MLASTWPAIALAIEPMRRTERPFGSVLLPGRVSPKPSTTDSSPRTAATTRPGAPELSASTVPIMDVASFNTRSSACASLAVTPAVATASRAASSAGLTLRGKIMPASGGAAGEGVPAP